MFSSAARNRKSDFSLQQFLGNGPPSGNSFDNPHLWDTFARNALRLNDENLLGTTAALRNAFEEFKLDPVDPYSWRILLSMFVWVEFGKRPRGKAGAPKKWNKERLAELRAALAQVQAQAANATLSDKEAARQLARDPRFGAKGSDATAGSEGLRKAIRKARRDLP